MKIKLVAVALVAGVQAAAAPVAAQDANLFARDRNVAVNQRPRPELQALGVRLGSFMAYPKVQVDLVYDDNVTAAETNTREDWLVRVMPGVELESDWSRHSLTGYARGTVARYFDFDQDNSESGSLGFDGRVDAYRTTAFTGGAQIARQVEPRTASGTPQSIAEPVEYDQQSAYVGVSHAVNRVRATGRLDVRVSEYLDATLVNGSTVSQADRDQTTYEATGRLDYAISPATALFGRVVMNERSYESSGNLLTPNRDSNGYTAMVGANFELTDLIRGEAGVGYLEQTFDNPLYGEFSGLSATARLEYFATPLLTLGLNANRAITDSGIVGSAGILATTVQVTADYEARRNILINARIGYTNEEFDAFDMNNDRWSGGVRATYLMNRRIGLTASYDYETRDSSGTRAINDFTANRFLFSIVAQY